MPDTPKHNIYNSDAITRYLAGFAAGDDRLAGYLDLALSRALRAHEPNLQPVAALPADAPAWMQSKWEAGARDFVAFQPDASLDGQVRHVADWIKGEMVNRAPWLDEQDGRGRPRKLLEIGSLAIAINKADKTMRRRSTQAVHEDGSVGTRPVMELSDGFCIVELLTPQALDRESKMLGHCIGNGAYDDRLGNGDRYYSLRDRKDKAHATFAVGVARHTLTQCKGKQNKPPVARYMPYVRAFIERERFYLNESTSHTGLVQGLAQDAKGCYHDIYHLPKHLSVSRGLSLRGCTGLTALPEHLTVSGDLELDGCTGLTALPEHLTVSGDLELDGCTGLTTLPEHLSLGRNLDLDGCTSLTTLPEHLTVSGRLSLTGCTGLTALPEHLTVSDNLDLNGCTGLTTLPKNLSVSGRLSLTGCTGLTALPEHLSRGRNLDLTGCTSLTTLPENLSVSGSLSLDGCTSLTTLPENLSVSSRLSLSGCTDLTALPEHLSVSGEIDLTGCTGLKALPAHLSVSSSLYLNGCTGLTALPEHLSVSGDLDLNGCTGLKALPPDLVVMGRIFGREDLQQSRVREAHHHGTLEASNRTHDHRP